VLILLAAIVVYLPALSSDRYDKRDTESLSSTSLGLGFALCAEEFAIAPDD